jgi:integrase
MPKLKSRPPKYSKMGKYAVAYCNGKPHYLGRYGSPESKVAYSRFVAELQANPTPSISPPTGESHFTVRELTAAFLDDAKVNTDPISYGHCRVVILDFLDKLYGDKTLVDSFKPSSLTLVQKEMIKSGRYCRRTVNDHTRRIISIFAWGVRNDLVQETTWRALKSVKALPSGTHGTFDKEERQPVPDDVVRRTLPFMPQVLRAMVQLQRILGMRPHEIFRMRVGDIDTTRGNGLWYYVPGSYKTARYVGRIVFPLGKPEQALIAPYLEGKAPEAAVFSPRTAMAERNAERRANRKTKISPSQAAKAEERASKPTRYNEFFNRDSYRNAIQHAITKGNKILPDGEKIPHWFPYQLRHAAATDAELAYGDENAQALLGHRTVNMTKRYSKDQLAQREELARNRANPFEMEEAGTES